MIKINPVKLFSPGYVSKNFVLNRLSLGQISELLRLRKERYYDIKMKWPDTGQHTVAGNFVLHFLGRGGAMVIFSIKEKAYRSFSHLENNKKELLLCSLSIF